MGRGGAIQSQGATVVCKCLWFFLYFIDFIDYLSDILYNDMVSIIMTYMYPNIHKLGRKRTLETAQVSLIRQKYCPTKIIKLQ